MSPADLKVLADLLADRLEARRPESLIDADAAARMLGVPKTWVLARAREGGLPCVKLGHYTRFSPAELAAWARKGGTG